MSGIKITNEEEGLKALKILHNFGPKTVILSSFDCGDKLETLASTMKGIYVDAIKSLNLHSLLFVPDASLISLNHILRYC